MTQSDLNNCNEPGPIKDYNFDQPPKYCGERGDDCDLNNGSLLDVPGRVDSWLDEPTLQKMGNGDRADCDPMLKGHIINQQDGKFTDRNTVYRYSKSLRGSHEAVQKLFNDIIVIDESRQPHTVPIIWGTQEKAVMAVVGENYRKDNSTIVDRLRLPLMAIVATAYTPDMSRHIYHKAVDYLRTYANDWKPGFAIKEKYSRDTVFGVSRGTPINISYTLHVWTMYEEDMLQIMEQIMPKIVPMGYIRVKGISEEIPVRLESMTDQTEFEVGDQSLRVIKAQFNMIAETYISLPLNRQKAVLKTRTEIVDTVDEDNVAEVIARLEQAVEEM